MKLRYGVEANDDYMSDDDVREGRSLWEELKEEGWIEIGGKKYCDGCKDDAWCAERGII